MKNKRKARQQNEGNPGMMNQEEYYCPMHCEGDKMYDEPGDCPVCGMHLIQEVKATPYKSSKYTCPMHPKVVSDTPGSCPICGMDLVPMPGEEKSEEEVAYQNMAKRFWIALGFSLPVFLIASTNYVSFINLGDIAPKIYWRWAEFILTLPVVFYAGWDFFVRGWNSVRRWSPNMWTLITLGVGAAFLFSVAGLFFPGLFPAQFKDAQGFVHLYFDTSSFILALVLLGQVLELRAHSKTNSALKALLNLVPPTARVIRDGKEQEIPVEAVVEGDIIQIRPGEKLPVDGVIVEGNGVVDEGMITGESIPVDKAVGDSVIGGTVNGKTIGLGNQRLIGSFGAKLSKKQEETAQKWQQSGQTVMYLLVDKDVAGMVSVSDQIKETSYKAVKALHKAGLQVMMLTGDNEATAKTIAGELGIDGYQADCLPEDKYNKIKELQDQGHVVAMAGDGINDAPALTLANIGIAMGTGTDIAMQSVEMTLVKGNLNGIVRAHDLSRKVIRNIFFNVNPILFGNYRFPGIIKNGYKDRCINFHFLLLISQLVIFRETQISGVR